MDQQAVEELLAEESPPPETLEAAATSLARASVLVANAPEGLDALFLAERLGRGPAKTLVHVARDGPRMARLAELAAFFAPRLEVVAFPAWDCLPYDRVSPNQDVVARRLVALAVLAAPQGDAPRLVITTANALVQKVPPPEVVREGHFAARTGDRLDREALVAHLVRNGYRRTGTVVEAGEFALRGGLIDVFSTGAAQPLRLDLFGNVIEAIREFDPGTQRTQGKVEELSLQPVSEVLLDEEAIRRFRVGYLQRFGAVSGDPLFDAIESGRSFPGMEHWLPLFHERLVSLFAYLEPSVPLSFDHLAGEALAARIGLIGEHHKARLDPHEAVRSLGAAPYRPLPPDMLYLSEQDLAREQEGRAVYQLSPFAPAPQAGGRVREVLDVGGRPARDFAPERTRRDGKLFDAVAQHIREAEAAGRRVVLAGYSEGSLERLRLVLEDHGVERLRRVEGWAEARAGQGPALAVLRLEHGFESDGFTVLAEQDILGDRIAAPYKRRKRADRVIAEVTALAEGDFVVHAEHGIGRFDGLVALEVGGAPHDCLRLVYHGGDKLFVPVENLDVLSRYGAADGAVALDRLGGLGWQTRKAKVKQRIREMADELVRTAAARRLREALVIEAPHGVYEEFAARFPFEETEDQDASIQAVLDDLASGRPMDRLICGDVGFGKTEVALRAAFVAAMAGRQVALLAPTTLLVRQHFRVFCERFAGFPLRVEQLSRFVAARRAAEIKKDLAAGKVDVVIGTHALLGKGIGFKDLGLIIVDEEQHFGVAHKERLKQLRAEVHVLTMTATPIPRTLQMALGGIKDLSIIATPPVDRLAVRSFVLPADPVVIREAILREHYRGGQSFYVCPRVEHQGKLADELRRLVPEVKLAIANGQMPARALEDVMSAFYDRRLDLLVATNIIESGLDIPSANTLIVHRSDLFGLSQLYQLRGRIGRSKVRGYAYFTLPPNRTLGDTAEKRLQVIQTLDGLGAGFQLASHDLDIRGSGNLLGEEQSGHIREVGFELYNHMLEEAVAELRREQGAAGVEALPADDWTPQITVDAAALMPETYIGDLDLRLAMYRRLASLATPEEIEAFAAELIDRFGPIPPETENLLKLVAIKQLCRKAHVARVEAGPKGIVLAFHDNRYPRPDRLIGFIGQHARTMKVRPDHRLVVLGETRSAAERLRRVRGIVDELAQLAA